MEYKLYPSIYTTLSKSSNNMYKQSRKIKTDSLLDEPSDKFIVVWVILLARKRQVYTKQNHLLWWDTPGDYPKEMCMSTLPSFSKTVPICQRNQSTLSRTRLSNYMWPRVYGYSHGSILLSGAVSARMKYPPSGTIGCMPASDSSLARRSRFFTREAGSCLK